MLAGLIAIVVLSTATDAVLHATGVFPLFGEPMSDAFFVLAAAYRAVFGVLGCYLVARLASDRPLRHAMALGVVGLAVSILGAVTTWNRGPEFGPHWYPLAVVAISLPTAWVGGWLRERQLRRQAEGVRA